jgi:hypothetical protein
MPQDVLDYVTLRWPEERDDLHRTAALRTGQRVEDLEIPLGTACQFLALRIGKTERLHSGRAGGRVDVAYSLASGTFRMSTGSSK